ncbi:MAG: UDP-N-acetylmuramoyl-L-alanyl-D-glutamate--2,6-diaminopimelate ligase [Lawsonibacter sp.]|nr:UDP-N-acetylmuramoyl-L-alanyl-D-glutamate--2,6-diaminopimelate ligase [Lawsonibacter sp.]
MKLRGLLAGVPLTGGTADLDMEINSISYDSRTLTPGALFVALPGEKTDGHRHIASALEKGAAAVLCREAPEAGPWLSTPDPRKALALVSANWFGHPGEGMVLVGVTGTNGKTTTTCLIKALLEGALGARVGLIGTNQNMVGDLELPAHRTTPESYELQQLLRRMADGGCTHVVMEVSSHALVQHRVEGLAFDVGLFTNLTQDHLDYHGTMEAYRAAKGKLFEQSARAVLNLDDEAGRHYARTVSCPVLTYSESRDEAGLTAKNIRLSAAHVEFEAVARGQIARVHLPIPGGFTIYNALAALACGLCLNIPLREGAAPLRSVRGVKGRVEVVPVPAAYTVMIDYAHTPDALENILTTARDFTPGRLICLFGCGGDRDRSKRPLMGAVAGALADVAVVTSDNPRTEDPRAIIDGILTGMEESTARIFVRPDRKEAIRFCLDLGRPGDVIVLAGKGHETYQEIQGIRYPLDEREAVAEYFRERAEQDLGKKTRNGGKPLAGVIQ